MKKLFGVLIIALLLTACDKQPTEIKEESAPAEITVAETTVPENSKVCVPEDDYNYEIENGEVCIKKYKGVDKDVVIPDALEGKPVTSVSDSAFMYRKITSITFPESVKSISGVLGISDLEVINLPASMTEINVMNFRSCDKLREINIPDGAEFFKSVDNVLYTADGKKLVMFPQTMGGNVFLPEGVCEIGESAFYKSGVSAISFPETLVKIGNGAFESCNNLTFAELPFSLREIGEYAFSYSGLQKIVINNGVEKIGRYVFGHTKLSELYLPDSVKEADDYILGTDSRAAICAYTPTEGLLTLDNYERVIYRNETLLQRAIRQGKSKFKWQSGNYDNFRGVFADLDGDNFPEMIIMGKFFNNSIYKYSETGGWQEFLIDCDEYYNSAVNIYYDSETDSHFYIHTYESVICDYFLFANKITFDSNGNINRTDYAWSGIFYPMYENSEYVGSFTCFEGGGKFKIVKYDAGERENDKEFSTFKDFVENSLSEYELVESFDFREIIDKYNEKYPEVVDGNWIFIDGEFADRPEENESKYNFTTPEKKVLFKIGEKDFIKDTYTACLEEDEITAENFEKLAQLPKLTSLFLSDRGNEIDLTGIDKLTNIRYLYINAKSVTGVESLKNATNIEWLDIVPMDNIDFLADMDSVRVIELFDTMNRPADYFTPVYDMESLQYIPVSIWESIITQEQVTDIEARRPDIKLCYYKIG